MNKKSQVTIFVIIAIVLVFLVVGAFFLFNSKLLNKSASSPEVSDVYSFVKDCIQSSGDYSISEISEKGGYFFTPSLSTNEGVPYYFFNNHSYIPSKEKIESELSKQIRTSISLCTNDFEDFKNAEISPSNISVVSSLNEDSVISEVDYPLSIKRNNKTFLLNDFGEFEFSTNLNKLYGSANEVVYSFEKENSFCLSCIKDIAIKNNVKIDIQNTYNNTLIFIIKDKDSIENSLLIEFIFAIENEF
jgi:hypothetical protein